MPTASVSIIIPVFNYEHYVARAIRSALAQDYAPLEVVVVDDGSTDGTAAIARQFADRGVRVYSQKNQGLAAARNTGIRHAQGELLFFLDADDFLELGAITRLVCELEELGPEWALVACQAKVLLQNGSLITPMNGPKQAKEVTWEDLMFGTRFPCTVLIRRKVMEACGGFDADFHHLGCEDRDMWLRVAKHYRIWTLADHLVVVAFHGGNMSSNPARQLAGIRRCLGKAIASKKVPLWQLPFRLKVWAVFHTNATLLHSQAVQHTRATYHALLSLLLWPFPGLSQLAGRPSGFRFRRLAIAFRDGFLRRTQPNPTP
jgi:glycosyltransferase involved in cell wall biosynthesis